MSNYTQATDFSAKDSLSASDPEKIILGADVDNELALISTAITSKLDTSALAGPLTISGNITFTGTNVIPAAGLTGTVVDARLSANVPLLNAANIFTATPQTLSFAGNVGHKLFNTSGAADSKKWDYYADTTQLHFRVLNDVEGAAASWLDVTRSSATIAAISLGPTLTLSAITFGGVAASDFARLSQSANFLGGVVQVSHATSPEYRLYVSGGATDEKYIRLYSLGTSTHLQLVNDAFNTGNDVMIITRSGTTSAALTLAATAITLTGTVSVNGVASTDFARLSQANAFAANQTIALAAGNASLAVNANVGTTAAAQTLFSQGGATKGQVGVNGSGALIISGGTTSALAMNGIAGVELSGNAGTTLHFRLDTSGLLTTPNASASEVGYKGLPQNIQSVDYTLVLTDAGKHVRETGVSKTVTIPANASVAFPIGTVVVIHNDTGGTSTSIAITTDNLYLAGAGFATTGTRTLANGGLATLLKVGAQSWIISGPGVS